MSFRSRAWGVGICTVLLAGYAVLPAFFPRHSLVLTGAGDGSAWILILVAAIVAGVNGIRARGQARAFWLLFSGGCLIWSVTLGMWTYYEVLMRRDSPDPFVGDMILFLHVVPLIAAAALQPHYVHRQENFQLGTLNFLMLLIWWMYLYAFVVFPDEYVVLNRSIYTHNYDRLYAVENMVLLAVLAFFVFSTRGAWRKVYAGLMVSLTLYTMGSTLINTGISRGIYYTGSWYDIPLLAGLLLLVWTCINFKTWNPTPLPAPDYSHRWRWLPNRLAMLAMLSAPLMGVWALFSDPVPARRHFRLAVTFACMLVLGTFLFLRQSLLDHELLRLLGESRTSLENLQRVQQQLVQKEKLASVGQLAAGVAHEINNPLAAILGYSELLMSESPGDHTATIAKISAQAKRTRDLVSRLLSFAQQTPAEKRPVQVGMLLQQALQVETLRMSEHKIAVSSAIPPDLPRICANASQILQCFMQLISNARDAMAESGGGTLSIVASRDGDDVVVMFRDTGAGVQEPERVFDPFYTTKAVGKGSGLGLSATYGIVQDHGGQITCENLADGGAEFIVRLPATRTDAAAGAAIAGF